MTPLVIEITYHLLIDRQGIYEAAGHGTTRLIR